MPQTKEAWKEDLRNVIAEGIENGYVAADDAPGIDDVDIDFPNLTEVEIAARRAQDAVSALIAKIKADAHAEAVPTRIANILIKALTG